MIGIEILFSRSTNAYIYQILRIIPFEGYSFATGADGLLLGNKGKKQDYINTCISQGKVKRGLCNSQRSG